MRAAMRGSKGAEALAEARGPSVDIGLGADERLGHLELHAEVSIRGPFSAQGAGEAIAYAAVGLVSAHVEGGEFASQDWCEGGAKLALEGSGGIVEQSDVDGSPLAVQCPGERVNGEVKHGGRLGGPGDRRSYGVAMRAMHFVDEPSSLRSREPPRELGEETRVVLGAVQIDDEARDGADHQGSIENAGEAPGQGEGAGIPAAMGAKRRASASEARTVSGWDASSAMLAGEHDFEALAV
jgi:hypothetical protein